MSNEQKQVAELFETLCRQEQYTFPEPRGRLNASYEKGVYVIRSVKNMVVHVGRTPRAQNGISQRLKDHLCGNSSFVGKHLKGDAAKLRQGYTYQYLVVKNDRLRALLEAYAIGMLCPAHIG